MQLSGPQPISTSLMEFHHISLNPNLDIAQLSSHFAQYKRIRIENVLTEDSAEALLRTLKEVTAWRLAYTDNESNVVTLSHAETKDLSASQSQNILSTVYSRASSRYQFVYKYFPIIDAMKEGSITENSMLHQIGGFLNSSEFIKFARTLCRHDTLVKIDPQATLYEANHFLSLHDDKGDARDNSDGSVRRFALVLGFTKNWSVNWGGEISFFDSPNAASAEAWYPGFNTLTIFEVPALHRVSPIAPFAPKGRYSITGWLRDDQSIHRADIES